MAAVFSMTGGPVIPNPTTRDPTFNLRYVERDGATVLQQMWSVKTFHPETCACIGLHGEWQDVPIEDES